MWRNGGITPFILNPDTKLEVSGLLQAAVPIEHVAGWDHGRSWTLWARETLTLAWNRTTIRRS